MRKVISVVAILALVLGLSPMADAQCNSGKLASDCIPKLQDGYNFVKSYTIDGQGGNKSKVEYSYVFAKGTNYFINICSPGQAPDGIVVAVYNSDREQVMTNLIGGKLYPAVAYDCTATGIYYITYTFQGSANHCGGSVLGFRR